MRRLILAAASGMGLGSALVVRGALRAPVFPAGDSEPWLLTSVPGPWLLAAALAAGAALGIAAERRGRSRLLTPFLVPGLGLALLVPGAFQAAPFLSAFSGRFLDLLLAVACGLSLWRFAESRGFAARRLRAAAVVLGALVVSLAVGSKMQRDVGLSGDEPHYLLVAHSLLDDGDLAVENNYREEDYLEFYGGKIGPHLAAGTPYSVHGVGLPILLTPGFGLLGLNGVLLTEAVLAALLLREVFLLALALTSSRAAALFAAATLGLTAPGLFLSVSAYPELPAALIVAAVARRSVSRAPLRAERAFLWTLVPGTLPFLHVKFLPLAGILWTALAVRARPTGDRRAPFLSVAGGAALSLACLLVFSLATTGSPNPTASYGRQRIFLDRIPVGVAGLFFDQEFGLLPSAPVYLLGVAGIASLARRSALAGFGAGVVLAAVLLPGAAHPLWSGGNSPPARFLFPALPLLAVGAGCAFAERPRRGVSSWAPALLVASVALAAAMTLLPGQPLYLNARDGTGRIWEALSSSWDLTAYLPSVVAGDPRSVALAAVLFSLLAAAIVLSIRSPSRFRLAPASLVLLLLGGAWVQDLTGARPSRELEDVWASSVLHSLDERGEERFLVLPGREKLTAVEAMSRVTLPLEGAAADANPRLWTSRPYAIPAGRFRIEGVRAAETSLSNGSGCFSSRELEFRTRAGLLQFRARLGASGVAVTPRLRMLESAPTRVHAVHTVALADGSLLHGLDDEAYLDPRGFWVKAKTSASFALEPLGSCPESCTLEIVNGAVENVVEIVSEAGLDRIWLEPGAARAVTLTSSEPLVRFAIGSERGFRPADVDPASRDLRALGVFLRAPAVCSKDAAGF